MSFAQYFQIYNYSCANTSTACTLSLLYDYKKQMNGKVAGYHDTAATHIGISLPDNAQPCLLYGDVKFVLYDYDSFSKDTKMCTFW